MLRSLAVHLPPLHINRLAGRHAAAVQVDHLSVGQAHAHRQLLCAAAALHILHLGLRARGCRQGYKWLKAAAKRYDSSGAKMGGCKIGNCSSAAHSVQPVQHSVPAPSRHTCAIWPLPPTTGMMSVTVLLMRPLMFWLMLLWLTGGCARTLPPIASRNRLLVSMMRAARSCSQAANARASVQSSRHGGHGRGQEQARAWLACHMPHDADPLPPHNQCTLTQ